MIASGNGEQGSVSLNANAMLYAGLFDAGEQAERALAAGRIAYVHLVLGRLVIAGKLARVAQEVYLSMIGN